MKVHHRSSAGRRRPAIWLATAALSIALVSMSACGDESATDPTTTTSTSTSTTTTTTSTTIPAVEVPVTAPPPPAPPPAPQAAPGSRDVAALVAEFNRLDQECRGQSGDLASTWLACDLREAFAVDLEARGQCSGDQGWSACGSTSAPEWITNSCDAFDDAFDIRTASVDCGSAAALIRQVSRTPMAAEVPTTVDRFTCLREDGPGGSIVRCGDYGSSLDPVDTPYGAAIWSFR